MSASNLVVPVVLWGRVAPTHCVSSILMTSDQRNLVTGSNDGQIVIWDLTENWQLYPRCMLFGHTTAVTCLAKGSSHSDKPYIVSSSDNGEMCLWDISDGRCIEHTKLSVTHTDVQAYSMLHCRDVRLVCNGYYPEIHVMDPMSLEILYSLSSRITPNWISALCILRPVKREEDVVVAISNSGIAKVWTVTGNEGKSSQPIYENESKQIRCLNAQTLRCCAYNQRTVLIVCSKYWQIYDAGDFSLLCSESNRCGERWSGGEFISVDRVVVWSNEGKGYLFKLPTNLLKGRAIVSANPNSTDFHKTHQPTAPQAYTVLDMFSEKPLSCSPAMTYILGVRGKESKLLLRGDSLGQVVIWAIPEVNESKMKLYRQESFDRLPAVGPKASTSLQEAWDCQSPHPSGIIDQLTSDDERSIEITSTIYIPSQGKLVCGREDGSIVLVSATQSLILQLLDCGKPITKESLSHRILHGHNGRVNCLLYPCNDSDRYDPCHLISGGVDFTICLWDIAAGTKLHTFCVHGGEVTQLMVPPPNCNVRILSCICSVASDHSVALISLKERKCIMLAGRHLFPVQAIKWRPLDDFLVVSCTDGTVYVWQMETGHLDRVIHGVTAEEVLYACDEKVAADNVVNPTISIAQAFRRRNLATFRNLAQQRIHQLQTEGQGSSQGHGSSILRPQAFPMLVQGLRTNTKDTDAHVLFFDTEALIVNLLSEEFAHMSPSTLDAHGFFGSDKSKAGLSDSSKTLAENNLNMEIAQLFMSCLHAWDLDQDLDKLCLGKLGLLKPRRPICFGLLSRGNHMSLLLPGWCNPQRHSSQLSKTQIPTKESFPQEQSLAHAHAKAFLTKDHWQISTAVTTQHLLSVISVANTLMSMNSASFLAGRGYPLYLRKHMDPSGLMLLDTEGEDAYDTDALAAQQAQIKQGWSLLAALHCVLLPDLVGQDQFKPAQLQMLAKRWQDRCLEIREAGQALLLAELRRIGAAGRKGVVDQWSPYLPSYVDPSQSLLSDQQVAAAVIHEEHDDDDDDDQILGESAGSRKVSHTFENRRKQATAIVMMGVIGAEFGQEIEPSKIRSPVEEKKKNVAEGFGLGNYSHARHTSKALTFLLLQPPSPRLPAHTPIRRAAIDLIGRGYTVWEPYLDVSAVLLGLLELCIDAEKLVPSMTFGLPLSPAADSCRTARHALSLIATARPASFIITMAKEVARYNAMAQNTQAHTQAQLLNSVLVRAKPEILRVIELLIDKIPNDVVDFLVEVMDVVVHCVDNSAVKTHGLQEIFPSICRFCMVSYCHHTRRICVGGKNGGLAFYEMKQSKCQIIAGHKGAVSAVAFSPDGKFLASHSHMDNKLYIWQTASSSLFGIGSQQTRCVKSIATQPCQIAPTTNMLKLVRLVWTDPRTVVFLTSAGLEVRYKI